MVPIEDRAGVSSEVLTQLAAIVATQHTLHDVVTWGLARNPPRMVCDVVVQDEYTHDVVFPYEGGLYLVYDTT